MFTKIAESVYGAYLAELRKGAAGSSGRRRMLRRTRRQLLKFGDPDITTPVDGFAFRTPFSSNILLLHFEFPFYDSVLPRLARAVGAVRSGLVMMDVGANVGSHTYLVSRQTGGHFFCIEANPRFKECLRHNLAQIARSRLRFAALNDVKREAAVRHHYALGNSNIETAPAGGELLEFITLDEALAAEPDFPAPNLVKIDTEGFELKILRGAARTLAGQRPALFFEFCPAFIRREGGDPDALFDLLRQHGYDHFMFYDSVGHLLTSAGGAEPTALLQSLRRYAESLHSYFDVAAFHAADATLSRDFQSAENEFFDRSLHSDPAGPAR